MKKIAIFVLCLALALSLCACACTNGAPATTPSTNTVPSTGNAMPTETMVVPVPETNIPDPTVDTAMPDMLPENNGTTGQARFSPM